jgi:methylase of polypeptide subunit release factors
MSAHEARSDDSEPLIQDAYFTLSGDRHTFFPDDQPPPKRVLDIGTGTGG